MVWISELSIDFYCFYECWIYGTEAFLCIVLSVNCLHVWCIHGFVANKDDFHACCLNYFCLCSLFRVVIEIIHAVFDWLIETLIIFLNWITNHRIFRPLSFNLNFKFLKEGMSLWILHSAFCTYWRFVFGHCEFNKYSYGD